MLVVRRIEGAIREKRDEFPVARERRREVVELARRQRLGPPIRLHLGDHQLREQLLTLRRLRPHEVLPIGREPRVPRLTVARMPDQARAPVAHLDGPNRPVVGDRSEHLPRRIRLQVEDPSQGSGPDSPRRLVPVHGRDLDRVLPFDIRDERGQTGVPEDEGFAGADGRIRTQRPSRAFAVGEPEGLAAPFHDRGIACMVRADAVEPGLRIEAQRLHLRSRQGHGEGADGRIEAVEDLDLPTRVPDDAGAVGRGVTDIPLGLGLVCELARLDHGAICIRRGGQTVDDPQVRLLIGMVREGRGPVGGEHERVADPQRIRQRRFVLAQQPLPLGSGPIADARGIRAADPIKPQPRRGASPVALPVCRRTGERRGQSRHSRMVSGQARSTTERQPIDVTVEAHGLHDMVADLELSGIRTDEDMSRIGPTEHRHRRRSQPGEPTQGPGGHLGDHELRLAGAEGHERDVRSVG